MRRVAIIGCSGSGKSTLARRLGAATGLPVVHIDSIAWLPGWKERDKAQRDELLGRAMAGERWIIDGNYSSTMPARLAAADTIIWLDLPRRVCLWRIVKRWLTHRGRTRPDMGADCPEKIDLEFLLWVWNYPKRSKANTEARLKVLPAEKTVLRFTRQDQVERWLADIGQPTD